MKVIFSLLILFCLFQPIFCKAQEDSVGRYISSLNSKSVQLGHTTLFSRLILDSLGQRLVLLNDKTLNEKLLSIISDTTKTLAAHVILTKRIGKTNLIPSESYVYENSSIVKVYFTYNKFTWYLSLKDNSYHIRQKEAKKIKQYWTSLFKIGF